MVMLDSIGNTNFGLKDPSQSPPFSKSSKLLIFHGEVKSHCYTASCVPESTGMLSYL